MASAGWYPDPGGQPGMYRYWDGHAWSAVTSPNPAAPPPNVGIGQPGDPAQQPYGSDQQTQAGGYGGQNQAAYQAYQQQARKRSPIGWWIGAGALAVVIILIVALVVRNVGGGGTIADPIGGGGGGTDSPCPTSTQRPTAEQQAPTDGRVHGGPLSYPRLSSPWGAPQWDDRVAFGSDVQTQNVVIEPNYDGGEQSWVASVLVAQLLAGDGFFTPEQGSEIVAKCIEGSFYGDNPVEREDRESKAIKVDGHDAWYLEAYLTFDIEGLEATGETMIIVIVDAGDTSGLYYASIPNNAEQYLPTAQKTLEQLQVDS